MASRNRARWPASTASSVLWAASAVAILTVAYLVGWGLSTALGGASILPTADSRLVTMASTVPLLTVVGVRVLAWTGRTRGSRAS